MIIIHITHSGLTGTHTVEDQVQYFENRFGDLVDKACREVKEIDPTVLFSRVTCLPVSVRQEHRTFIEEKLTNIRPPAAFESIWSILNLYWDFLNHGLLEHVINQCGSKELKQEMQTGHAETKDLQKGISRKWFSKCGKNGPSAHYKMWSHSKQLWFKGSSFLNMTFFSKQR